MAGKLVEFESVVEREKLNRPIQSGANLIDDACLSASGRTGNEKGVTVRFPQKGEQIS